MSQAFNMYMKLSDSKYDGESQDEGFKNAYKLASWSWGAQHATGMSYGGGQVAGVTSISDLSIMKPVDKSHTALALALYQGTSVGDAVLSMTKSQNDATVGTFFSLEMKNVFVTSQSISDSAGSEEPMEALSFSFQSITMKYWKQDDKGILQLVDQKTYDQVTKKAS
jgi:type VI secretion system Hcp family effector